MRKTHILVKKLSEGELIFLFRPYFRERAVDYARKWAFDRNPRFGVFDGIGGDCTNFVSQCIFAGCCTQNYEKTFGWYYIDMQNRAPAWTGVKPLYDFLTGSGDFPLSTDRVGPYGREVERRFVEVGDVVQLRNEYGEFYHAALISDLREGEIFVCAHADDSRDRPLSTYRLAAGYRYIHIEGAIVSYPDDDECFDALLNGDMSQSEE